MHKQNNYFTAIHFNFVCIFIDSSVEIFDSEYLYSFAMKLQISNLCDPLRGTLTYPKCIYRVHTGKYE